ncbi:hypothetical protein CPB83DRAFT_154790 [Crepidotus variabilis]|uniref:Uncharacterized protein n=1 Tax=Crepidotus variabilis TaxID=179855 RepID=A0A9P6EKQ6_9AGAR|nr:hypothetical protein CPB83DRAFT_154790 [Crepidotus variabilis]
MDVAQAAAAYVGPVSDAFVFVTKKVHPIWFPYALAPTLHAARVSTIFQANVRRSPTPLSWGQYITGFLIMSWGGTILSCLLLGLPAPMLYSVHPFINYVSVHLFCTALFTTFPNLLSPALLDTTLWPIDALLRTNGIIATLGLFSHPSVHPEYKNSALTHLITGAIASAAGGVSVGTIGGFTSNWTFGTPPFLRAGAGWAGTLDLWGGALVGNPYLWKSHWSPRFR